MAKIYQNQQFKIIEANWVEYVNVTDTFGLCDLCANNTSEDPIYYIAVLDQWYCKTCLDAWLSGAKKYKSDIEKEQLNFINVKHKLEDLGAWNE
jgi:hypothetical protein